MNPNMFPQLLEWENMYFQYFLIFTFSFINSFETAHFNILKELTVCGSNLMHVFMNFDIKCHHVVFPLAQTVQTICLLCFYFEFLIQ